MKNVEQLFIDLSKEYEEELQQQFFQSDLNTYEYFDTNSYKDIVQCMYLNILMAEYYIEYSYKFLNEYFKINNSLKILGATENDPHIKTCVEIIKDIFLQLKNYKIDIITLLEVIFDNNKTMMQPSSATMLNTITFGTKYNKPETAFNILENTVRALIRAEAALSTLDHITTMYFEKHRQVLLRFDLEENNLLNIETQAEIILDAYLELKLNYLINIKL